MHVITNISDSFSFDIKYYNVVLIVFRDIPSIHEYALNVYVNCELPHEGILNMQLNIKR